MEAAVLPSRHDVALDSAPAAAVRLLAIVRGLIAPLAHAVVAHDGGDPQPVVAEHAAASCLLRGAMLRLVAPSGDRRLVAPERQRQHLVGIGDALEALDGK